MPYRSNNQFSLKFTIGSSGLTKHAKSKHRLPTRNQCEILIVLNTVGVA